MRRLFLASDLIEAHLLEAMLQERGIQSFIKNQDLQSGVGELPFVEMWPEVWLNHETDFDIAQIVLNELMSKRQSDGWCCLQCHERNPGTFELCWRCEGGDWIQDSGFTA
jgi:ribosomal protein L40E